MGKLIACAFIIASTIFLTEPANAGEYKVFRATPGPYGVVWSWSRIQVRPWDDPHKTECIARTKVTAAWDTKPIAGPYTRTTCELCPVSGNSGRRPSETYVTILASECTFGFSDHYAWPYDVLVTDHRRGYR